MKFSQSLAIALISLGFLLGACASGGDQTTRSESPVASPEASPAAASPASPATTAQADTAHDTSVSEGGQVVEAGPYHLELVTLKEASGVHLDFYLQKGDTHEAIPDATVTGQIQLPDGTQKTVEFEYDAAGEHYVATLPDTAAGEYNVAILTDIKGEKVNGRFNFSQ
ncbi:hypothetical protein H6G89_20650 [Oscillatoria sp. FACHB-1407]|uniref:hypothetical protein n=1 Tax=Oscillatoria sp. FACHB-1407 TaxID=2692847 RepID=UPI00168541E9|nr:hypothetical protein [Oscillatoria sp. FACHB-1407]MBD2463423.1 hypothetical protein [Oscillatoria sp. FACHB-1407]